ncbi:MAG: PQQ-binding-like beta-propeller repeat protein [Polyangiales bacterium]|nr:PQQ-binding-like beta-propeller repeat protein [Sandaracinaceae bacterium]
MSRPWRDGELVCSARDGLIYVDIARGVVLRRRSLPGIDRLFPPVEFEGDLLFPYANRASGGLVRFASGTGDVAWKCVRRGQITPTKGHRLLVHERTAVLSVNGGSSLVGVDVDTGETRWSFRAQWLYTPLEVDGSSIIFGTAGGHGRHLRRHDVRTGETEWAVPMKGGCPYYARCGECLVAGDWNGVLRSVRATDGVVVDEARVGPHLAGPPLVVGDRIYVLRWSPDGAGTALLALDV